MATANVGIVAPVVKGAWDSTAAYDRLNIVHGSDGATYQAIQTVPAGTALSNTEYWMQVTPKAPTITSEDVANDYGDTHTDLVTNTGTPMAPNIHYKVPRGVAGNESIDDTKGAGDTDYVWSADKSYSEISDLKNSIMQNYVFPSDVEENKNTQRKINLNPITTDIIDISDNNGNILASFDNLGNLKVDEIRANNIAILKPSYSTKYDFSIQDENGNIVFGIVNKIAITNQYLYGKKLSIIGDSVSTYSGWIPEGYATYYPHGEMDNVQYTWWWKLCNELGLQLLKNASWSGSTASGDSQGNASAACSDTRINDLKGDNDEIPDIIICFIGSNDWGKSIPLGDFTSTDEIPAEGIIDNFADAYALMLYKIRTVYPNASIYCVTPLRGRPRSYDTTYPVLNENGDTLYMFDEKITQIADIFCCHLIDLDDCGLNFWNVDTYTVDNKTHPNIAGANILKNAIKLSLIKTYYSY